MKKFDLLILGGGPAGYNAAEKAAAAGLKCVLIEKRALGGVCLNEGCIPSKALLYSAKIFDYSKNSEKYGIHFEKAELFQQKVIARKNKIVKSLVMGIGAKLKKLGVEIINDEGFILGKETDGFKVRAGDEIYSAPQMLLATGSQPVIPGIPSLREGLESGFVLTNREILDLEEIPESLVVIGGGVIGIEMASYFNSAGSKVTVIEMLDHIAGETDSDISKNLLANYKKKGIDFRLNCTVTGIENKMIHFKNTDGATDSIEAAKVLCSIGRRPVIEGFGLENLKVQTENGAVVTDDKMKTGISGLYAAGDVNGKSMLAHTAYREGEVAINNILGKSDRMRYNAIPAIIYTNPEVACIGTTIASALEKGFNAREKTVSMRYSGRYLAENEGGDGICKLVIDEDSRRILGIHMIGNYSSEIIYGAAMMIETKISTEGLKEIVFPHPTVGEVIREALFE